MSASDPPAVPARFGPVGYVTGLYPKVSHTFIAREIAALRAEGVEILTCSIRRPPAAEIAGEAARAEARATFVVLDAARRPGRLVGAHLGWLRRAPGRWLRALGLAWALRPPGLRAALWQLFYFAEAGVLADHLRRRGAVHLHNHFGDASGSVALLAATLAGLPFSYTMHGPTLFHEPMRWRIDAKTARAAFVACISHFARAQGMLFSDAAHWGKLRIVHCGVDPSAYGAARRAGFGQRLLFVGRLAAVKGLPVLFEALAALRPGHPGLHLTVVGDGPDRAALAAEARARGLDGAVDFTGALSEEAVAARMAEADILVLPSFAEGVPVVLMEAMASRMPVIATRVGGVAELVADGESGFLVPPGDAASLAERIAALIADPELCRRMGEAGRRTVAAEFDIAREARWLGQLFRGTAPAGQLRPDPARPDPRTRPG